MWLAFSIRAILPLDSQQKLTTRQNFFPDQNKLNQNLTKTTPKQGKNPTKYDELQLFWSV